MKKVILALAFFAAAGVANAIPLTLDAQNSISGSGTLSTLIWDGSNATTTPGMAVSAMASTVTWDWDGVDTLTSSGFFQTTSHLGSMAASSSVISDVVVDLVIDTTANTTGATSYECREGNFLAAVGANGCLNLSLGSNASLESSAVYNVGGAANCVNRTVGGDDVSTGDPRGLMTAAAGGGCDAVGGAFQLFEVVQNDNFIGGKVIISNGICRTAGSSCAGASFMTFTIIPAPAAGWLIAPAIWAVARFARRRKTAA